MALAKSASIPGAAAKSGGDEAMLTERGTSLIQYQSAVAAGYGRKGCMGMGLKLCHVDAAADTRGDRGHADGAQADGHSVLSGRDL